MTKERLKDKEAEANDREIAALRAVNGAANWLCNQSRPDLCVQTSFSQQCFPKPRIKHIQYANQLGHRAKQYSDVEITVRYIPWDKLSLVFHSDAGFGNAKGNGSQAGYIVAFCDEVLENNQASVWNPFTWKSMKLPRVASSALGAESQIFSIASSVVEWMSLMIAEAKQGSFDLRAVIQSKADGCEAPSQPKVKVFGALMKTTGITDCKSLYDHLQSLSPASKCDDKRVAIDLSIIKQCIARTALSIRWCPTQLMLADALTKDQQDPADLLRAALSLGEYQLNPEATILQLKKDQRIVREKRRIQQRQLELEHQQRKQNLQRSQDDQPSLNTGLTATK